MRDEEGRQSLRFHNILVIFHRIASHCIASRCKCWEFSPKYSYSHSHSHWRSRSRIRARKARKRKDKNYTALSCIAFGFGFGFAGATLTSAFVIFLFVIVIVIEWLFLYTIVSLCVCACVCAQQNYLQKMIVNVHALSLGFVGLFFGYFRPTIWQVSRTQEEKRERRRSTNKKTAQEQCRSAQFDSLFALWLLIKSLSRYAQFLTASSPNFAISHSSNWLC